MGAFAKDNSLRTALPPRRFQYRLITLLLVPLAVSLLVLPLASRFRLKSAERNAAKAICASGGSVYYASELSDAPGDYAVPNALIPLLGEDFFDAVVQVRLAPNGVAKSLSLDALAGTPNAQVLFLDGSAVTDENLASLPCLAQLRRLNLQHTRITDAGLVKLSHCPRLAEIDASRTLVTGASLGTLVDFKELRTLHLNFCPVSDQSISGLATLRQLRDLSLYGTDLSDDALAEIGSLDSLEVLNIGSTQITGRGLVQLARCKSLEVLDVRNTKLDDGCVGYFTALTQIINLDLTGTNISESGAHRIRWAIPKCRVDLRKIKEQ